MIEKKSLVLRKKRKKKTQTALATAAFDFSSEQLRLWLWCQLSLNWMWGKFELISAGFYRQMVLSLFSTIPFKLYSHVHKINSGIWLVFLKTKRKKKKKKEWNASCWGKPVWNSTSSCFSIAPFHVTVLGNSKGKEHGGCGSRSGSGCLHHAPVPGLMHLTHWLNSTCSGRESIGEAIMSWNDCILHV